MSHLSQRIQSYVVLIVRIYVALDAAAFPVCITDGSNLKSRIRLAAELHCQKFQYALAGELVARGLLLRFI